MPIFEQKGGYTIFNTEGGALQLHGFANKNVLKSIVFDSLEFRENKEKLDYFCEIFNKLLNPFYVNKINIDTDLQKYDGDVGLKELIVIRNKIRAKLEIQRKHIHTLVTVAHTAYFRAASIATNTKHINVSTMPLISEYKGKINTSIDKPITTDEAMMVLYTIRIPLLVAVDLTEYRTINGKNIYLLRGVEQHFGFEYNSPNIFNKIGDGIKGAAGYIYGLLNDIPVELDETDGSLIMRDITAGVKPMSGGDWWAEGANLIGTVGSYAGQAVSAVASGIKSVGAPAIDVVAEGYRQAKIGTAGLVIKLALATYLFTSSFGFLRYIGDSAVDLFLGDSWKFVRALKYYAIKPVVGPIVLLAGGYKLIMTSKYTHVFKGIVENIDKFIINPVLDKYVFPK